jgi:hypothetical protein
MGCSKAGILFMIDLRPPGLGSGAPRTERIGKQLDQPLAGSTVTGNKFVHLVAAMLTAHAPFAKVFAVVRQHVVAILA